jgi:hypothetical protein
MRRRLEPKIDVLPPAQREIWPQLAPAPAESLVLYGGTAVALHLGHRHSLDFDFFSDAPLDKRRLRASFVFMGAARTIQEDPQTLVVSAKAPSGLVRISFFGELNFGHVNPPLQTSDGVLLIASLEDLMATKLKAILDRAEAKDYRDIAAMLGAGISLGRGLAAFAAMFAGDPALPLRALGYFKDGDLPSLPKADQDALRAARNRVTEVPEIRLMPGLWR